ncbi:SRPBCC family protein [Solwaraspora sp. WMMD791]|uniref:SRPBCC family protein n=1 Tax=Solwaraspora sp. WMMD791 TaxID=3016086 RepID=UPI00249A04FD|nr:SRPBCC family protein [Solwaraspora sp. WMMD791]WFE28994.1 SRPBCC family protein [Solwaraspora sp. WMMD791]
MAVVQRVIPAPPDQVFAVLANGWTYSDWVVGTVHIRDVDDHWPQPGAALHHTAGPWPLSLSDTSTVVSCDPPSELTLRAGLWPLGEATVVFRLAATEGNGTRVTVAESFTAGPLHWVRTKIDDLVLHHRNRETLRRLSDIATRKVAVES